MLGQYMKLILKWLRLKLGDYDYGSVVFLGSKLLVDVTLGPDMGTIVNLRSESSSSLIGLTVHRLEHNVVYGSWSLSH